MAIEQYKKENNITKPEYLRAAHEEIAEYLEDKIPAPIYFSRPDEYREYFNKVFDSLF